MGPIRSAWRWDEGPAALALFQNISVDSSGYPRTDGGYPVREKVGQDRAKQGRAAGGQGSRRAGSRQAAQNGFRPKPGPPSD